MNPEDAANWPTTVAAGRRAADLIQARVSGDRARWKRELDTFKPEDDIKFTRAVLGHLSVAVELALDAYPVEARDLFMQKLRSFYLLADAELDTEPESDQ